MKIKITVFIALLIILLTQGILKAEAISRRPKTASVVEALSELKSARNKFIQNQLNLEARRRFMIEVLDLIGEHNETQKKRFSDVRTITEAADNIQNQLNAVKNRLLAARSEDELKILTPKINVLRDNKQIRNRALNFYFNHLEQSLLKAESKTDILKIAVKTGKENSINVTELEEHLTAVNSKIKNAKGKISAAKKAAAAEIWKTTLVKNLLKDAERELIDVYQIFILISKPNQMKAPPVDK